MPARRAASALPPDGVHPPARTGVAQHEVEQTTSVAEDDQRERHPAVGVSTITTAPPGARRARPSAATTQCACSARAARAAARSRRVTRADARCAPASDDDQPPAEPRRQPRVADSNAMTRSKGRLIVPPLAEQEQHQAVPADQPGQRDHERRHRTACVRITPVQQPDHRAGDQRAEHDREHRVPALLRTYSIVMTTAQRPLTEPPTGRSRRAAAPARCRATMVPVAAICSARLVRFSADRKCSLSEENTIAMRTSPTATGERPEVAAAQAVAGRVERAAARAGGERDTFMARRSRCDSVRVGAGDRGHDLLLGGRRRLERAGVAPEAQHHDPVADLADVDEVVRDDSTTASPRSRSRLIRPSTCAVCSTPSAAVGSSRMTIFGSPSRARAIATDWRWPPDSDGHRRPDVLDPHVERAEQVAGGALHPDLAEHAVAAHLGAEEAGWRPRRGSRRARGPGSTVVMPSDCASCGRVIRTCSAVERDRSAVGGDRTRRSP